MRRQARASFLGSESRRRYRLAYRPLHQCAGGRLLVYRRGPPAPIVDSFTYDVRERRVVGIDELFTDPKAAERAFAAEARRQLLTALDDQDEPLASDATQIDEGTAPDADHYRVFSLLTGPDDKVHGLTFIFPPYQVASYAAGPQAIDVPSEAFSALLKPEYREAFR